MKVVLVVFPIIILFSITNVYGLQDTYQITIDEHNFDISYDFDGTVIDMAIDQELNSLLIGITDTKDSLFQIALPKDMISAENNEFAVLVDQVEVDYNISTDDNASVLQFFVPVDSEEIEIIGTQVIPEFPLGAILVLTTMIAIVMLVTKMGKFRNQVTILSS